MNQKHGIYEYANNHGPTDLVFVEDTVTGRKKWHQCKLGLLLEGMTEGDTIIFAEVTRIACSTRQVLGILELLMERQLRMHIVK